MEIDLAAPSPKHVDALETLLRSQICIIGGGIAGLALANELEAHTELTVTLLEAGGHAPAPEDLADPFGAEFRGTPHQATATQRVRAFGGTSHLWGGQLLPLPESSGWPISLSPPTGSLAPTMPVDADAFFVARREPRPVLLASLPGIHGRLSYFLPFAQRNLAKVWGTRLRRSARIRVALHATVRELLLAPEGDRLEAVLLRTGDGRELRVRAEQFVLAAGTVETCRLLLASRSASPGGVGNGFGQVGRHFHDHLTCAAAELTGTARQEALAQLRPWFSGGMLRGPVVHSLKMEAGAELRRALDIPPAMAHLTLVEPEGTGVDLLRKLLRARQAGGLRPALRATLRRFPGALGQAVRLLLEARIRHRRYVSARARVFLQVNLAQEPSEATRISLCEGEGDCKGMPAAVVHWEVSAADLAHLRAFAHYLREQLTAAGRRDGMVWLPGLFDEGAEADAALRSQIDDARHAMGGACLGSDPRTSVVDTELRVHGIRNLSVASAAVFPDGGAQLPTATLLALCQRLAKRLGRELV